jgi:hypothetical protein
MDDIDLAVREDRQSCSARRRIRAELMTLAPGAQISADMVLRQHINLAHRWWSELYRSLDVLATFPTRHEAQQSVRVSACWLSYTSSSTGCFR